MQILSLEVASALFFLADALSFTIAKRLVKLFHPCKIQTFKIFKTTIQIRSFIFVSHQLLSDFFFHRKKDCFFLL